MRKPTVKSAHKRAKAALSDYIKLRDSLATTGKPDWCRCITCDDEKHWDETDPGHFIKATSREIEFDERNVHGQCVYCNRFQDGRQYEMGLAIARKLGQVVVDELRSKAHTTHKLPQAARIEELLGIEEMYKHKTNELAANQR